MAEISILAPLDGKVVDLEKVPDKVFAQKMVGDGVAIDPSGQVALAPVDGELVKLFPGGHAFVISTSDGIELIVHLGLDTVELNGKGFENIAVEGQTVKAGTPIVRFNRAAIEHMGKLMISPVVSVGPGTIVRRASGVVKAGQDVLFILQV
jgi:glucose-specific phosphotransferase system IIA component